MAPALCYLELMLFWQFILLYAPDQGPILADLLNEVAEGTKPPFLDLLGLALGLTQLPHTQ